MVCIYDGIVLDVQRGLVGFKNSFFFLYLFRIAGQTYGYQEPSYGYPAPPPPPPSYGYGHPAPAHGQSAHGSHAAHDQ